MELDIFVFYRIIIVMDEPKKLKKGSLDALEFIKELKRVPDLPHIRKNTSEPRFDLDFYLFFHSFSCLTSNLSASSF